MKLSMDLLGRLRTATLCVVAAWFLLLACFVLAALSMGCA